MKHVVIGLTAFVAVTVPSVAAAQDTLTPYLENQRWDNLRRTQQPLRADKDAPSDAPRTTASPPITIAARQAAWSRHKAEYRKRLLRDGPTSADAWLDSEIRAGR